MGGEENVFLLDNAHFRSEIKTIYGISQFRFHKLASQDGKKASCCACDLDRGVTITMTGTQDILTGNHKTQPINSTIIC